MNRHQGQQRIIAGIENYGGRVTLSPAEGPAWLRKWIGDAYFQDVLEVELTPYAFPNSDAPEATNEALRGLNALNALETLCIDSRLVTDEGLVHLQGLKGLYALCLDGCIRIRGRGFVHLNESKGLGCLYLSWTNVDDEGLAPCCICAISPTFGNCHWMGTIFVGLGLLTSDD